MQALDLTAGPPRRWTEELGKIRWLPRLIDKTAAALAGTLGDYLYGQSPVDRGLLRAFGLRYGEFTKIVAGADDDAAVLEALQARVPAGVERARAWSAALPRTHGLFLFVLDLDDGYLGGGWRVLKAPTNLVANAFTRWLKRRFPSKAAQL
ncbi:MAG TPA: DUF5069 domain-containing protein [Candidatus Baltobacteraceae bacterium]|jgi:hypothetical protein